MLELRPVCENCGKALPPGATDAMICSFECTYCARCAQDILSNVCPNCGGGFEKRPIRPVTDWKGGDNLANFPATTKEKLRPADMAAHAALVARIGGRKPEER